MKRLGHVEEVWSRRRRSRQRDKVTSTRLWSRQRDLGKETQDIESVTNQLYQIANSSRRTSIRPSTPISSRKTPGNKRRNHPVSASVTCDVRILAYAHVHALDDAHRTERNGPTITRSRTLTCPVPSPFFISPFSPPYFYSSTSSFPLPTSFPLFPTLFSLSHPLLEYLGTWRSLHSAGDKFESRAAALIDRLADHYKYRGIR